MPRAKTRRLRHECRQASTGGDPRSTRSRARSRSSEPTASSRRRSSRPGPPGPRASTAVPARRGAGHHPRRRRRLPPGRGLPRREGGARRRLRLRGGGRRRSDPLRLARRLETRPGGSGSATTPAAPRRTRRSTSSARASQARWRTSRRAQPTHDRRTSRSSPSSCGQRDRPVPRGGREPLRPSRGRRRGSPAGSPRAAGELAEQLAASSRYPDSDADLLRVSQYVDAVLGEGRLYRYLHEVFDSNYPPTSLHRLFARLPAVLRASGAGRRSSLLTTNYDDLLERALRRGGRGVRRRLVRGEARTAAGPLPPPLARRRGRSPIERPNEYTGVGLERAPGRPQAPRRDRPRRRQARQLRHHRGQLHRLPRRRRRRRADPVRAARADGRQPLPVPRLLDARLEPARDPEPDLGRPAARPEVVGGPARPGRPGGARGRARALARPRRRRPPLHPAEGLRRGPRRRALRPPCPPHDRRGTGA